MPAVRHLYRPTQGTDLSRILASNGGFTYIAALFMVMILGIMLGLTGQSMRTIMKREKEKELIFRGLQYRDAIERWSKKGLPLKNLNDLLKDPYSVKGERLLRQLYKDPITGKDFKAVTDPNFGIIGVQSTSEAEPMKAANFPEVLKDFEGKEKYSEWKFVYNKMVNVPATQPGQNLQQQENKGLPLSTPEGP